MNKPAPMKGKGRRKTDRQIWLMKNLRDQQRIDSEYIPRNFKKSKTKAKKNIVNRVILRKQQLTSFYNETEFEKENFPINVYILWLIFFLFSSLKTSS